MGIDAIGADKLQITSQIDLASIAQLDSFSGVFLVILQQCVIKFKDSADFTARAKG